MSEYGEAYRARLEVLVASVKYRELGGEMANKWRRDIRWLEASEGDCNDAAQRLADLYVDRREYAVFSGRKMLRAYKTTGFHKVRICRFGKDRGQTMSDERTYTWHDLLLKKYLDTW